MITDEYTDEALNAEYYNNSPRIGQENSTRTIIYPRGVARYRDANWMP